MAAEPPSVLVMARAPRRGEVRRALEPVLGPDGCAALHSALLAQAGEWARDVAPGRVYIAHDPPDAGPELRPLFADEPTFFPQTGEGIAGRLANAAASVFAREGGPLLIAWPDLPRLRSDHAAAAIEDLADGCDLVLGPVFDGGFYLIALARPLPALFELAWGRADGMTIAVGAARDAGLSVGLLRAERALNRPADVHAILADPLAPESLRRLLEQDADALQARPNVQR